jgi:hypothetical protein
MTRISIDLDASTAEKLEASLRAHNRTLEDWLRVEAEKAAQQAWDMAYENTSHRAILAALKRPDNYYETARDALYDRENQRAQAYEAARKKLLELIDTTEADMGACQWDRSAIYAS